MRIPRVLLCVLPWIGVLASLPPAARAASDDLAPRYEVALGLGGARAFEEHLFNVALDSRSRPDAFVDLRVRQNSFGPWAFGIHIYGTAERTDPYEFVPMGSGTVSLVSFDVTVVHMGVDARYLLAEGPFQPYLEAGLSYVAGSADDPTVGHLNLNGFSVGGGPGAQFVLTRSVALAVEGVFAAGTAKWERRPFSNSSSRDYDPSLASVAGMLVYRWGL